MTSRVPPADFTRIAGENGMTVAELREFVAVVQESMVPIAKNIPVTENGVTRYYTVERCGVGPVVNKNGKFWMYDFTINDQWMKYRVLVKTAEFDTQTLLPVFVDPDHLVLRTDSGCETGQVFGDKTCDCGDQLHLAMEAIEKVGEGMIVNIPSQDGRGMGLPFKLGTLWLQDTLRVHTVDSASMLEPSGVIDIRTYSGVVAILIFLGIPQSCEISLATNNPEKAGVFGENGYLVNEAFTPVIAVPNEHNRGHLLAKELFLGHRLSPAEG